MKKQYIHPATTIVVLIAQNQLMADSDFIMTLNTEEVSDETSDFVQASRRKSLWDDDEE